MKTRVSPGMMPLTGEGNFVARLCTHLAGHHHVATRLWFLSIPNRRICPVASPSLIEVCVGAVGQLMQPGSIGMNDVYCGFPFRDIRIVLQPTEKDQHVASLRPGRFEVIVSSSQWFVLWLTIGVHVDFTIHVIRASTSDSLICCCFVTYGDLHTNQ